MDFEDTGSKRTLRIRGRGRRIGRWSVGGVGPGVTGGMFKRGRSR